MPTKQQLIDGMEVLKHHVAEFEKRFAPEINGRKSFTQPKNHDWRPYRWCSRDIVFALTVVKHNVRGNLLEADVCLMANPEQYVENSGAMVALGFLLSEAYKCGGSMAVAFTSNVEGGRVPAYICDYAICQDIELKHVFEGQITPKEARQLYLSIVGFSEPAKKKIMELAVESKISPERVCFLVLGGVWSLPEAESILLSLRHPDRIFNSAVLPNERLLYLSDLILSRQVILGGTLDRKLLRVDLKKDGKVIESEDYEVPLEIGFCPDGFVKIYKTEVELLIPWLRDKKFTLSPDQKMAVLVRAGNESEIRRFLLNRTGDVHEIIKRFSDAKTLVFVLTTRDFEDLSDSIQNKIVEILKSDGVYLMVSPDTSSSLDSETIRRLETGKMVRK